MQRVNKDGFTLIELMVVVTIILIVSGLSLMGISQAKGRVHQMQCANNVRQLGLALQEFRLDHHFYPPLFDQSQHDNEVRNWRSALGSEMDIQHNHDSIPQGVWHCPSASRPDNIPKNLGYDDYGYNAIGLGPWSYTNSLGLSDYWVNGPEKPIRQRQVHRVSESEVVSPSAMLAMGDGFYGGPSVIEDGNLFGRATDISVTSRVTLMKDSVLESTKRARSRHKNKANVVFCDGHLELLMLKNLFTDSEDEALSRWNRDNEPHRERLSP